MESTKQDLMWQGPETGREAPLNVEELMNEIRRSVEEKRQSGVYPADLWGGEPSFGGSGIDGGDRFGLLRVSARVDLEGEAIQSHRRMSGLLITTLKRISRFWVRKYTDPLFLRQGTFNTEAVNALLAMQTEMDALREELNSVKRQLGS